MPLTLILKDGDDQVSLALGPERKIEFSAPREIAKLDIPGWRPQYQDMGCGERSAKWSGLIQQDDALAQAEKLRALMDRGRELTLIYGEITAKVRLREFNYQYHRSDYVRYDITLVETAELALGGKLDMPLAKAAKSGISRGVEFGNFAQLETVALSMLPGQTLRDVALQQAGSPHLWMGIARLNGLNGPDAAKSARTLIVPANRQDWKQLSGELVGLALPLIGGLRR